MSKATSYEVKLAYVDAVLGDVYKEQLTVATALVKAVAAKEQLRRESRREYVNRPASN